MTNPLVPEYGDVPVDDDAEPDDAGTEHDGDAEPIEVTDDDF